MFFSNALKSSKKATPIIDVIISVANITIKNNSEWNKAVLKLMS